MGRPWPRLRRPPACAARFPSWRRFRRGISPARMKIWRGTDEPSDPPLDLSGRALSAEENRAVAGGVLSGEHLCVGAIGGAGVARLARVRGGLCRGHGAVFPDAGL